MRQPSRPPELLAVAVKLLARREHSRAELQAKLSRQAGADVAQVGEALDALTAQGYLSDRRFAEQLVRSRQRSWGRRRLESELARRGVDKELAENVLAQTLAGDEVERALAVLRKKNPEPLEARSKQELRCRRFLAMRGFSSATIGQAISAHRAVR